MKKNIFLAALFLIGSYSISAQKITPFFSDIHRIVFLGNSITHAGTYISDVETYFLIQYPQLNVEFINVGLPSETVSGLSEPGHAGGKFPRPDLHERLQRILVMTKPDLIIACYGMNDGIYLPYDEQRFQKFKDGITWLHDEVIHSGASIIHVTPPVYDELVGKRPGYASVLDTYSQWLISQQEVAQWKVIDTHFPMKKYLEDHRSTDSTFVLAKDGVHPGALGHWLIARQILSYMGEKNAEGAQGLADLCKSKTNVEKLYSLVTEKQAIMKDAWLTATGHIRPGMKTGLPLPEAERKASEIQKQILLLSD